MVKEGYKTSKEELDITTTYLKGDKSSADFKKGSEIYYNYRSNFGYVLNTFRQMLINRLNRMNLGSSLVSQRFKRIESVIIKLNVMKDMTIRKMQDIGGIRIIVDSLEDVEKIRSSFATNGRHETMGIDNYILKPKASGYRSVHIKFKSSYKDRDHSKSVYNGLRIELQIRTTIQHSRATAVEMFTTFLDSGLKSGNGKPENIEFFILASQCLENKEKGTPDIEKIKKLKEMNHNLQILKRLQGCKISLDKINTKQKKAQYNGYVSLRLLLKPVYERSGGFFISKVKKKPIEYEGFLNMIRYKETEFAEAYMYIKDQETKINQSIYEGDIVLVKAKDLQTLKKLYPNYFVDHEFFTKEMNDLFNSVDKINIKLPNSLEKINLLINILNSNSGTDYMITVNNKEYHISTEGMKLLEDFK